MNQLICGQTPLCLFIVRGGFEPLRQLLFKQAGISRAQDGCGVYEPASSQGLFDLLKQRVGANGCKPCRLAASGEGAGMHHVMREFVD